MLFYMTFRGVQNHHFLRENGIVTAPRSSFDQALVLQILRDESHTLLDARLLRVNMNLRILRRLVRSTDAGELFDFTRFGLLVQSLWVSFLGLLDWNVDEDFDEGQGRIGVLCICV